MKTIRDYFSDGATKAGSYNKLSAILKTTCGNMTRISIGAGHPGDEMILRLASYLGEDPKKLLLLNQAEKASETARPFWSEMLKKYGFAAVFLVCLSSVFYWGIPPQASTDIIRPDIYYRTLKRYIVKILSRLADTLPQPIPGGVSPCFG